jgi:hypothetical protein
MPAGVIDLADMFFYEQIRSLWRQGGDVIVSFGGANGVELAQASALAWFPLRPWMDACIVPWVASGHCTAIMTSESEIKP